MDTSLNRVITLWTTHNLSPSLIRRWLAIMFITQQVCLLVNDKLCSKLKLILQFRINLHVLDGKIHFRVIKLLDIFVTFIPRAINKSFVKSLTSWSTKSQLSELAVSSYSFIKASGRRRKPSPNKSLGYITPQSEHLPPGHDLPWKMWKSLHRLRT